MLVWIVVTHAAGREFKWNELQTRGQVSAGTILPPEAGTPFHRLKIEGSSEPKLVTVLTTSA